MGFGGMYGGGSRAKSGIRRYSNAMAAHVWNAQTEESGQSGNGNFYFERAALYSYGSHFLVAYIMPDGVALFNADSYSVSTSGHQSDAYSAASNRTSYSVPNLTDIDSALKALSAGFYGADSKRRHVAAVREFLTVNAAALAKRPRGAYRWQEEESADNAGLYLAGAFGLARSWPAIQREGERRKAKAEREAAKAERQRAHESAVRLADMTDSEFRAAISRGLVAYDAHELNRLKLALYHGKRFGKANGFSKRRLETLKAREKRTREVLAEFATRHDLARRRQTIRTHIASIRNAVELLERLEGDSANTLSRRAQEFGGMARSAEALKDSPRFPSATRFRLAALAAEAKRSAEATSAAYQEARQREHAEAERARAMQETEYRQAWLAGEAVSGRRFDSEHGGAALRVRGDSLETSHGAEVPLAHAVKAFRFLKLIRQRGEGWQRNGKTIRVGHFQIDRIEPSGDFVAGCHRIAWQEAARIAAQLGLDDLTPSAEAVETKAA